MRMLGAVEKRRIREERERIERADFPNLDIQVIVEDYTYGNGEPVVRVIGRGVKPGPRLPGPDSSDLRSEEATIVRKFLGQDIINSGDLPMLQRVFELVCVEDDKKSAAADDDARLVVALFESGYRRENVLIDEIRRRKAQS